MRTSLVTPPALEPVSLEEAKAHLRVDGDDEDVLIANLITAAREWAEAYTDRAFITQTWDATFDDGFPACVELYHPPLIGVTSVTYVDGFGVSQTLAADQYRVDAPAGPKPFPGRVSRAYGVSWPSTQPVNDAVSIRYQAGYGGAAEDVPAAIRSALLLLIGELYKTREDTVTGTIISSVPMGVEALLWPFRVPDL